MVVLLVQLQGSAVWIPKNRRPARASYDVKSFSQTTSVHIVHIILTFDVVGWVDPKRAIRFVILDKVLSLSWNVCLERYLFKFHVLGFPFYIYITLYCWCWVQLWYNIDSQQNTHVWNKPDKNYACIHFLNQHKRERNKILMENCLQN